MSISIVILTFNSIQHIRPCLDYLYSQDCQNVEVIVVDNGSADDTADLLKNKYPQVRLIENEENLGAARARNQGIEVSSGEWVITLDCDIVLEKDFTSKIIDKIKDLPPEVGMLQPKILKENKKIIYSTGIFLSSFKRFYDIGRGQKDSRLFDTPNYVFGACSAAAVYRKKMLDEIREDTGYFDERFFFLVEDVDLSWRAQNKGWKAIYYPEAVCYHSGNSSGYDKKTRRYFCFRNRLFSISKNEKVLGKIKLIPIFLIYDLLRLPFLLFNSTRVNSGKEVSK